MSRQRSTATYVYKASRGVKVFDELEHAVFIVGRELYNGNDSDAWYTASGKPNDGLDAKAFNKYKRPLLARVKYSLQASDVGAGACLRLSNDMSFLYYKHFNNHKAFVDYMVKVESAEVVHNFVLSLK